MHLAFKITLRRKSFDFLYYFKYKKLFIYKNIGNICIQLALINLRAHFLWLRFYVRNNVEDGKQLQMTHNTIFSIPFNIIVIIVGLFESFPIRQILFYQITWTKYSLVQSVIMTFRWVEFLGAVPDSLNSITIIKGNQCNSLVLWYD